MPESKVQAKDILHLIGYTGAAVPKAVRSVTKVPFKKRYRNSDKTYAQKVFYEILNEFMVGISIQEVQFVHPSTKTSYKMVCLRKGLKQRSIHLPNNTHAHWLNYNEKTKKNVLVWFHGGGYVLPCTDGHIRFLYSDLVKKTSFKYAVCILNYTLAPERQYPFQLTQAATLLNHLLTTEMIPAHNIVIGGDSAGGNLALAIMGHMAHPHPSCPPLLLPPGSVFRGALLMSPWVTFDSTSPSMVANEKKDYICRRSLRKWHEAFMGSALLDAYNTPLDAPIEWWAGVPVKSIFFTGGGAELFCWDIQQLALKVQASHPACKSLIVPGDVHDQPVIDKIMWVKEGKQCRAIVSWLSTLEIPGFESDRKMEFGYGRKREMNAHVSPIEEETGEDVPIGKLEHEDVEHLRRRSKEELRVIHEWKD